MPINSNIRYEFLLLTLLLTMVFTPSGASDSHSHGDSHHGHANHERVDRTIDVKMYDYPNQTMAFVPDRISVKAGENIRFVIHNVGNISHEFVIADPEEGRKHAEEMRLLASQNMAHDHSNSHHPSTSKDQKIAQAYLEPGERKELVWKFQDNNVVAFSCFIEGHSEAGMKGEFVFED